MFGTVDWNYSAGPPIRKGKSLEELGDAGWAREQERAVHLQQLQQLQQVQLQQQQVGYYGYAVVPPGQPQSPVMLTRPGDPVPGCPVPVHGGMMIPGGPVPPQVHVPAQWPVQWGGHPGWGYNDGQKAAFTEKSHPRQDVYFHPGSEDGHLNVRISEWKGKHCFYQGPENYGHHDYRNVACDKVDNDFRTGEELEDRRRGDNRVKENHHYSERYDRSHKEREEYDSKEKNSHRDPYDRQCNNYDRRENPHYSSSRRLQKSVGREQDYNSEYEDCYDRKIWHSYKDSGHYSDNDRDYFESRGNRHYREKERYRRRKDDSYYDYEDQRYYSDHYAEDRCGSREYDYKERGAYKKCNEETYTRRRRQYDCEPETHCGYREKEHYNRYTDKDDNERDGDYVHKKEHYDSQDGSPGEHSHHDSREGYRNFRSISMDSSYEEYPKKHSKTHCEEWVEEQNKKLALRETHLYEDPIVYHHSDEQQKGYESSAGSSRSKRGGKPVYVGSLDRNSFIRKTAPSSVRKAQFATTMRANKGKHTCRGMYFGTYSTCMRLANMSFTHEYKLASVVTSKGARVINTGGFNMLNSHTPCLRKYLAECVCVCVWVRACESITCLRKALCQAFVPFLKTSQTGFVGLCWSCGFLLQCCCTVCNTNQCVNINYPVRKNEELVHVGTRQKQLLPYF